MKVVRELKNLPKEKTIQALIGDGRTEQNILPAIFKRYNGEEIIMWCPWRTQIPGAGFSVLKGIKSMSIAKTPNRILFVTDKEMLDGNTLENKIKANLKGVESIDNITYLTNNALIAEFELFHRKMIVYACIMGKNKFIEECLSYIVKLEKEIEVSPTKEIWKELKTHGIKTKQIIEIIEDANMENLKLSFPNLDVILGHIEGN